MGAEALAAKMASHISERVWGPGFQDPHGGRGAGGDRGGSSGVIGPLLTTPLICRVVRGPRGGRGGGLSPLGRLNPFTHVLERLILYYIIVN